MTEKDIFLHERLFRDISIHAQKTVTICGAGAIGSYLSLLLTSQGFLNLRVIDKDRVEERNIGTQLFTQQDLSGYKADVLRKYHYKKCKARIEPYIVELTYENATSLLKSSDLVIDTFDNLKSRRIVKEVCEELNIPCIHAGMSASADGYSEVCWDEKYNVPDDSGFDLCNYPLALNLVWMTVTLIAEATICFIHKAEKKSYCFSLGDFKVREM